MGEPKPHAIDRQPYKAYGLNDEEALDERMNSPME